ncbi:hypothetical protein OBV_21940 [Oscillibacter valericigenes Sjm18-20]|nr:hypothetical protein OBV_21940 [Oscillibacter valericigenes Sjm18-20]
MKTAAREGKKSFLLYFDSYPRIAGLPAEQRGELLSALFEFAIDAAAGKANLCGVMKRHPAMNLGAQMAFGFMADTIHRDTEVWLEKQARYRQTALKRVAQDKNPAEKARAAVDGGEMAKYVQALRGKERT